MLLLESLVEVFGQEVGHVVEEVGGRVSVSGCRVGGEVKKFFSGIGQKMGRVAGKELINGPLDGEMTWILYALCHEKSV